MGAVRPLIERFEGLGGATALVWRDRGLSFGELGCRVAEWDEWLDARARVAISPGVVVALNADYSPSSVALLLALLDRGAIVALVGHGLTSEKDVLYPTAQIGVELVVDDEDEVRVAPAPYTADHPLLVSLAEEGAPGLILFSSGSTGAPKAVVHDGRRLLAKYATPRVAKTTIPFMLFDHIGGLNTLLHTLSSGGTIVVPPDRRPETICRLVQAHRVQVLPTSPTFLNLLLLYGIDGHDLSSLETIAYGAERMAAPTLARLRAALPHVRLVQSYGLSEVGIMRTKSEASDSLWVELGGDGFETRVRDGMLEVRAATAMIGYLNEKNPWTDDGWLRTGDRVAVKGRFVQILGRASDLIVVGGEKVYATEVEDQLLRLPGVVEASVVGEPNALTGQSVLARVQLSTGESRRAFRVRMRAALSGRLAEFKIPQRLEIVDGPLTTSRYKRSK